MNLRKSIGFLLSIFLLFLTGCSSFNNDPRNLLNYTEATSVGEESSTESTSTGKESAAESTESVSESAETENGSSITEIKNDGEYSSKDEVAEYIHLYNKLPKNFITKNEAKELGWVSSKGNLWDVAPGKSIGGDRFGNREGNLPTGKGLKYYECDINYNGGRRGAERIVYSNKGNIYYSDDHYRSFERLY